MIANNQMTVRNTNPRDERRTNNDPAPEPNVRIGAAFRRLSALVASSFFKILKLLRMHTSGPSSMQKQASPGIERTTNDPPPEPPKAQFDGKAIKKAFMTRRAEFEL
jgi:hypothetical protein